MKGKAKREKSSKRRSTDLAAERVKQAAERAAKLATDPAAERANRVPRFRPGELVHNRNTNEDGRVTGISEEGGVPLYTVDVPNDPAGTSWKLGAREARWLETDLEPSTNKSLLGPMA